MVHMSSKSANIMAVTRDWELESWLLSCMPFNFSGPLKSLCGIRLIFQKILVMQ